MQLRSAHGTADTAEPDLNFHGSRDQAKSVNLGRTAAACMIILLSSSVNVAASKASSRSRSDLSRRETRISVACRSSLESTPTLISNYSLSSLVSCRKWTNTASSVSLSETPKGQKSTLRDVIFGAALNHRARMSDRQKDDDLRSSQVRKPRCNRDSSSLMSRVSHLRGDCKKCCEHSYIVNLWRVFEARSKIWTHVEITAGSGTRSTSSTSPQHAAFPAMRIALPLSRKADSLSCSRAEQSSISSSAPGATLKLRGRRRKRVFHRRHGVAT